LLPRSQHSKGDGLTDALSSKERMNATDRMQGISIPSDENIALLDPGSLPGAIRIHTDDDKPLRFRKPRRVGNGLINPHRLKAEAEIATSDPAMSEQLLCHAFDRLGRDHKNASSGTERCHPNDLSLDVESRSPFRASIKLQIQMEPAVDLAAAQAPPGAARKGYNAESGAHPLRSATGGKHKLSDPEPQCVREGSIGDGLLLGAQEGNGRAGIAADETCGDLASVRAGDPNVLIRLQGLVCGDDKSRTPDDASR